MFEVSHLAIKALHNVIMVSGSARSGTTVVGKLIASFENVEYLFEPELLPFLFANIERIESSILRQILAAYLIEDLKNNSKSGRKINLRKSDDSCILNWKTKQEIERRLSKDARKADTDLVSGALVFKTPDFVYKEKDLREVFPNLIICRVLRDPLPTINSLIKKGWFSDSGIRRDELFWPNAKVKDFFIPHWLGREMWDVWDRLSEADRCAHYYITQTCSKSRSDLIVDYNALLAAPKNVASIIADKLGLSESCTTHTVVNSILPQSGSQSVVPQNLDQTLLQCCEEAYEEALVGAENRNI